MRGSFYLFVSRPKKILYFCSFLNSMIKGQVNLLVVMLLALMSACQSDTERIQGFEVHGIDLSHHQQTVNWDTIAHQQITFAFVKATEGRNNIDTSFCKHWIEMRRTGIVRGAYHYFHPSADPNVQALNYLNNVDLDYGDLPPVIDVEDDEDLPREQVVESIHLWLNAVSMRYNTKPIIYTNYKFYNKYVVGEFDAYPIWIAKYGNEAPRLGSTQWVFWQYGNRGKIKGIEGNVDFNVFRSTRDELFKLCITGEHLSSHLISERIK